MSVAVKRRTSVKVESQKCAARLWRLFPHVLLWLSLVAYAALGALLFQHIEGGSASTTQQDYSKFLHQIVGTVQNSTGNASCTHEDITREVETMIRNGFKSIWLQRPSRWTFFGSMFFCCTVFTTVDKWLDKKLMAICSAATGSPHLTEERALSVEKAFYITTESLLEVVRGLPAADEPRRTMISGYGEIYPVTLLGKVVCVLYAMVGIPLMLLVILDVGDFLAMLMSRSYIRIHTFCKTLRSHTWSPWKAGKRAKNSSHQTMEDGTIVFSHDIVVREPLDIRQVLHCQADVRDKSIQLQNNKEIFEKILTRDNLLRKGPLVRAFSCPELDQLSPPPKGYAMWDFTGLGDGMEMLDVPFVLITFIVFAYIFFGGLILPLWETEFEGFDPYYFCFITLTTIGFGDIVPNHPKYFMLTSLFIIVGMAIMSMAFKLGQARIVFFYRHFIKFISRGNVDVQRERE